MKNTFELCADVALAQVKIASINDDVSEVWKKETLERAEWSNKITMLFDETAKKQEDCPLRAVLLLC